MAYGTDPITAEVVARYLLLAAEEMGATLTRTAFSPNIKERADCSSAVFDAYGNVVAQAHRVPIHLGSMIGTIETLLKRFPESAMRPGDMFIANDPYSGGGTHLPDINVVAPVFRNGRIVAFVANIAHHADVGGMVPGSEASVCKTIFQEGLRIPLVRVMREGELNRDVVDIVLLNSRTPDERIGDLRAQFAANFVGIQRVAALFEKYSDATAAAAIAGFLDFTERRFAAAISRLPAGTYEDVDYLDGDGPGETVPIRTKLTIGDGKLHFDFSGSARQLASSRNIPRQALLATIYTVAKSLLDPELPANAGYYRTITAATEPGTVIDPVLPAAVGTRSITCGVLGDLIAAVLSQAQPAKALARSGPHHLMVLSGTDPRSARYFVNYETVAGGMGARAMRDGMDAVRVHASGAANLPVEALEHAFPFLIETYALRPDSGGAGQFRGGLGVVRDYRVLADDVTVSLSSERQAVAAAGLTGGGAGAVGQFILNPDSPDAQILPSAAAEVRLPRGSVLRVCTPGGGGFGTVATRDPAALARDRSEGRVT
jgi:N-methylhydantoinase B